MQKLFLNTVLFVAIAVTTVSWSQKIVYPWRATAAIVKSGENFEVWFQADANQKVNRVELATPFYSTSAPFKIQKGNWEYDSTSKNTYNTRITVSVPKNTPADRYDITIKTATGTETSAAGVKVITAYKDNYYILHFSDIHAFQNGYPNTLHKLSTVVDIANIINPEILFNTGDNLYRPSEDRMNQLFSGNKAQGLKGLNDLNAAAFTVVGNHDTDFDTVPEEGFYPEKSKWWNKWWGLQAYNFIYNQGRFMVINNGWVGFDPTRQIEEATAWLKEAGKGNFRLGAAHIKESELLDLDKNLNLNMVLVGHNHHNASTNPGLINTKTIQYISNSMRDHVEFNLYKINGKTGIAVPVSVPTAQVEYLENPEDKDKPELYKPKLVLTYAQPNDGKNTTNSASIVNKFDFGIEDARVRFVMPLGTKYTISKGKIEQFFDGQSYHIVDVNLNLEPNSTTAIDILALKE